MRRALWKKYRQTKLNRDQERHVFPEVGIKQLRMKSASLAKSSEPGYKNYGL